MSRSASVWLGVRAVVCPRALVPALHTHAINSAARTRQKNASSAPIPATRQTSSGDSHTTPIPAPHRTPHHATHHATHYRTTPHHSPPVPSWDQSWDGTEWSAGHKKKRGPGARRPHTLRGPGDRFVCAPGQFCLHISTSKFDFNAFRKEVTLILQEMRDIIDDEGSQIKKTCRQQGHAPQGGYRAGPPGGGRGVWSSGGGLVLRGVSVAPGGGREHGSRHSRIQSARPPNRVHFWGKRDVFLMPARSWEQHPEGSQTSHR